MLLTFTVRNQTLTYRDTKLIPRIGSSNYLQLRFIFVSKDWNDLRRTLQISAGEYSESYILESDIFDVPPYYTQQESFNITLLGDESAASVVVPTNVVTVMLDESNTLWTATPPDPQSSAYLKVLESVGDLNDLKTQDKSSVVGAVNEVYDRTSDGGSLPAMSSDTAGKMLTNDGEKAEWGGAVRYDVAQNMNGNEQLQARKNIGAFPGKRLRYFFDTTTGSAHDNDIIGANNGDVISPGNIYTDGDITNKDMVFPAYVLSVYYPTQSSSAYYVRLLDANGIGWQVLVGHDSESGNPIIREITSKNMSDVMRVIFREDADGNWSADKNWDDAAALIEAGGYVYAMVGGLAVPFVNYVAGQAIVFHMAFHNTSAVMYNVVIWHQDGLISASEDGIPIVMYGEQTLTADQQAQARKNIGAGTPYTLPIASPTQLGGVKPVAKTDAMTQSIGVDGTGGLYVEPSKVYYIDLEGAYPDYTCPVAMADIEAAYEAGKVLECRCAIGQFTATLPLFVPVPEVGQWVFSGSGDLADMSFPAQTFTVAVSGFGVQASNTQLATKGDIPTALKNPNALTITIGDNVVSYDGSEARAVTIPTGGSSGGETWELINTFEVAEADAARVIKIDKDSNGNAFSLKEFAFRAVTNSTKTDGSVYGWFCVNGRGTYNSGLGGFVTNFVRHPSTGAAIANDVIGRALPCGLVYDQSTNRKAAEGILATSVTDVHEVELAGYQHAENQLYGTFQLWGVRK